MVQVEVAGETFPAIGVTFFAQHDFVNQPGGREIGRRQPGNGDATHSLLQRLEQRHEVPHGEHMLFHEGPQRRRAVEHAIDWMMQQRLPRRLNGHTNLVETHRNRSPKQFN